MGGCRQCRVTCLPGRQPSEQFQARMSQSGLFWHPHLRNAEQLVQSTDQGTLLRSRVAWSSRLTSCGERNSRARNNGWRAN
eukprot:1644986-Amphidinium_carterae.1